MKNYRGIRKIDHVEVKVLTDEGMEYDLDPRFDLANHSPDGFEWGYCGSGPSQLALAILCDYLQDDKAALAKYQSFKNLVISNCKNPEMRIDGFLIQRALSVIGERDAKVERRSEEE